jgi:uncharacterized membrane protein YdjX (TVP38/TMEM64 family)
VVEIGWISEAAASLPVFVLLTLWCHGPLSPLLPAAYEPVLLAYGQVLPPLLITAVGAVCSTAVEYLNYHLYRKLLRRDAVDRVLRSKSACRVVQPFFRYPFLTVWFCVLSPLPDWAARILASHSGYPVRRYLVAVLLARLPRFWLLTALGFHLRLSVSTLLAIGLASAVLTLAGIRYRRSVPSARPMPCPQRPEPAMRGTFYLLLAVGLAAPAATSSLQAQETRRLPDGFAMGGSMDRFIENGFGTTTLSFRLSQLRQSSVGTEIGVSLFPEALVAAGLIIAPDLGAAYNVSLPNATVLLKAGGSGIIGLGQGLAVAIPGLHLGAGLNVRAGPRAGVRFDVIRHFYQYDRRTLGMWSLSFGLTLLPRAGSPRILPTPADRSGDPI